MSDQVDTGRRQFLTVATVATGAVGAAFAAVPFLASWKPSARAKALGAPVEVDISKVEPGAMIKVEWRGKAVFVVHRTPQMLTQLEGMAPQLRDPDSKQSEQPDFAQQSRPRAQARVPRAGGRLHAPGLRTARSLHARRRDRRTRLAGWILLPLPRLQVRPFRPGLQGRAGADEPVGPALPIPERQPASDRRRNGERMMSTQRGNRRAGGSGRLAALRQWIDDRFPMTKHVEGARVGVLRAEELQLLVLLRLARAVVLVIQIVTGIFLTMNYKPSAADAFSSVEYIMRDVEWGWLIRYMHSTGASAFFIVVYLHMFRALLYGSYQKPRELLWIFGMLIYLVPDGRGVLRLPAALGQHVLLGRAGDRVAVRRDPVDRQLARRVDPRRLLHLGRDAQPVLRAARRRAAAGADVPGRRAHPRAARGRARTTRTASRSRRSRARTAFRSTASRSIRTTR